MKAKMLVALIAVTCVTLLTSCKPKISGQITAKWQPDTSLRLVDGQLYDAYHSELWKNPLELAGFQTHNNANYHFSAYFTKVETVEPDKIQCGVYEQQVDWPLVANGESGVFVQEIVIYHYPNAEFLVSGQKLGDCRCMRVANYNSAGISIAAFDCGVQYSKPVPMFNGARIKIDSVQVFLIGAKEVDDFLEKKKSDADQQCSRLESDIEKLQLEIDELQSEKNNNSQSYTNDPRYIAAIKESDDAIKTAQTLANAITYLRSKYGDPPPGYPAIMSPLRYPQEQRAAWNAIVQDTQRIRSIRRDANRIDDKIDSVVATIKREKNQQIQNLTAKVNDDNKALKPFQTPNFFLADFSPTALETSLTDAKGDFVIHNPKPGTKIFAKVKPDTGGTNEEFFWLVDLPQKGEKLILSETNLFTISTNTP